MSPELLHGIWTVLLLLVFVGIVLWAWSGRRKRRFEQAARMPLDDDVPPARDAASNRAGRSTNRDHDHG